MDDEYILIEDGQYYDDGRDAGARNAVLVPVRRPTTVDNRSPHGMTPPPRQPTPRPPRAPVVVSAPRPANYPAPYYPPYYPPAPAPAPAPAPTFLETALAFAPDVVEILAMFRTPPGVPNLTGDLVKDLPAWRDFERAMQVYNKQQEILHGASNILGRHIPGRASTTAPVRQPVYR